MRCAKWLGSIFSAFILMLSFTSDAPAQQLKLSLEEIAQNADLIFIGSVKSQSSRMNDAQTMIFTDVVFKDIKVVHATGASVQKGSSEIRLTYAGGRLGDMSIEVGHAPALLPGHRYLIFMTDDGPVYSNPIVGGEQGLFEVITDVTSHEEFLQTGAGKVVIGVGENGITLSKKSVTSIEANVMINDQAQDAASIGFFNQAAVPANARDSAVTANPSLEPDAQQSRPLGLNDFLRFIVDQSLKKSNPTDRLKRSGVGVFYRRNGDKIEAEPLMLQSLEPVRLLSENNSSNSTLSPNNGVSAMGGPVGACGYQSLPIVMEQVPTSFWSYPIINDNLYGWNQFMDMFRVQASDGTWNDNSTNEFAGFIDSDTLNSVYGFRWAGSALAVTVIKKGFLQPTCGKIVQTDVFWNPSISWTDDAEFALGNSSVVLLRSVNLHETGHVWGLQDGSYTETYDYDVATVMQPYYYNRVEDGWGIHSTDAYLIRRQYQDQTGILGIKDVGVESYYASNGLNNSVTDSSTYSPGQSITLYNVTVENMSYAPVSDMRLRFYLSTNRTISTADYQLGSGTYWYWTSFPAESYNVSNYTTTIPSNIPAGQYYVGAILTINGFGSDDYQGNNSTSFYYGPVTVLSSPTITVGQGAPNPQLFIDAYNRNNLSQYVLMPPVNVVHRWNCSTCDPSNPSWSKGWIQDFNGNDGFTHDALMQADTNPNFVALIYGGMWTKFLSLGDLNYNGNFTLGYPIADRNCSDFNATCFTDAQLVSPFNTSYHYQRFQAGALVLHRSGTRNGQTYEVHGAIRAKWQELGGPGSGSYGLPITDEYAWQNKRRSDFEGGSICYNPATNQTEPGCVSAVTVQVTIQTSPAGRSFTVDGNTYSAAQTFSWTSGSSHTISTTSPQNGATGTRYAWAGWSDGGAISHSITPTSNGTYTANFNTQYFLTMSAGTGGTVSPPSNWYNSGQSVSISATANGGFSFSGWNGSGTGSFTGTGNPATVTMNGPITETASFAAIIPNISVTVQTNPAGRSFSVDGTTYTAARTFSWPQGSSHSIATTSPQSGGVGTLYVWNNWNDGGAISHTVAPTINTTYTANFTTVVSPPSATTLTATQVAATSATLNGSVNPNGTATNIWFEWGTSSNLATFNSTPLQAIGSGSTATAVSANLSGLAPGTTYYFRVAGSNTGGTSKGAILNLITPSANGETVWVDDRVPTGSTQSGSEPWNWRNTNPTPFSGTLDHQSNIASGLHNHYFYAATETLPVNAGEKLFAYVYIDPANPVSELMLQWFDGALWRNAYWGADNILVANRQYMGPLPATGQWVRLEVAASVLGLEGKTLSGMAFNAWNGRVSWDRAGKAGQSSSPPPATGDQVWVEDNTPAGSIKAGNGEGWNWISSNPTPFSGSLAHQSNIASGLHNHYFYAATETLPINAGEKLFAYVYIDPANPVSELMLQWSDGVSWYNAYWGADNILVANRQYMGPLPATGQWVRLEVAASALGLEGRTLSGMAFNAWNGRASWDRVGKSVSPPPTTTEQVWVEDSIPSGGIAAGNSEGWNWINTNPAPFSGSLAHQSNIVSSLHNHYFYAAASTLKINAGDKLFCYVYIDPANPVSELMLQWSDGVSWYNAYWGADNILVANRQYMGPLPATGQWVRLEVAASVLGVEGKTLSGMAFNAWNGRVSWDKAGKIATPILSTPEQLWVEDKVPTGSILSGNGESWNWINTNPTPFSGSLAHQSNIVSGLHNHYFYAAAETLAVNAGEKLFAYVYIDPANPVSELMLQWFDGALWRNAYWGADNILVANRQYMGPLPAAGQWVRLEVAASVLGVEGKTLSGMAFNAWNGRVSWDRAGKTTSVSQPGNIEQLTRSFNFLSLHWELKLAEPDDRVTRLRVFSQTGS